MKKLLAVTLFFSAKLMAQMPQADMNITGAGQSIYVEMPGIKNNKINYIRETAYKVDTTTHQANMQQIDKITVYSIAYFNTTPLLVKLLGVLGTDTNKLVRNEMYNYDPATGLLMSYQTASDEGGFQMGAVGQVARDSKGLIVAKVTGFTFDLKQPAKPTDYKVMCSGETATNVRSVILKSMKDGKEVMDRISMDYDGAGRLISTIFASPDKKNTDKLTFVYNAMGTLKEIRREYTYQSSEYIPETEGFAVIGAWVPGTKAHTSTKMLSDTSITNFEYDTHANITTITYTYKGKLASKEVYTYTANGLPETVKQFDEKGRLTALRKFICQ